MRQINTLLLTLLIAAPTAMSQPSVWKVDRAHSNVKFAVSHLVIAEVTGRFKEFDATLTSTKDDFSDAQIEAVVQTASIDTDNERRDNHLRSNDFLNAEKFPEMKFSSTSIEKTGKDKYRVRGDLTIRDITKPVVLDMRYNGTVKDPWGNTKAGFKATTTIDRFEFGTTWNVETEAGGLVAGRDIEITLLMELQKQG